MRNWDGAIQYTIWMVVHINGQWYTAGGVECWHGLDRSGGPPSRYASNWYDDARFSVLGSTLRSTLA